MIKSDVFTAATSAAYLLPDSVETGSLLIEREDGGLAISDPSLGISGYSWICTYTPLGGIITLTNEDTAVSVPILSGIANLVSLSFAFDSNMRYAVGYTDNVGVSSLRFYDSLTESYTTLVLPAGTINLRLCHDDKRPTMVVSNVTDILCFYVRDSGVYYRLQRERYQTEHRVATVTPGTTIAKVGMTSNLTIRAKISGGSFISSP